MTKSIAKLKAIKTCKEIIALTIRNLSNEEFGKFMCKIIDDLTTLMPDHEWELFIDIEEHKIKNPDLY